MRRLHCFKPEAREEQVHKIFESICHKYDLVNSIISFMQAKLWRKDIIRSMNLQKGGTGLDLCCGTADLTIPLAKAVGPGGKLYGLDFSDKMLAVALKKIEKENLQNIAIVHGNARELPFAADSFDFVTIAFGLRNVADYRRVLKEMFRVLKPGGKVACLETARPSAPVFRQLYFFYLQKIMPMIAKILTGSYEEYIWLCKSTLAFLNKDELKEVFKKAGFEHVQVKEYSWGVAALYLAYKPGTGEN